MSAYLIMDGRAHYDVDVASVLDTADTLDEARREVKRWGDAVVVDAETMEVVA